MLQALLPEAGKTIRGNRRSYRELQLASGYVDRPGDFEELLVILGRELRLISLSDAEGAELGSTAQEQTAATEQYFQLTHDYLVPSLREWLTREQKQTRRGRAELLLAERASLWERHPKSRILPGLFDWLRLRALTRRRSWTTAQAAMMRQADRRHIKQASMLAVLAVVAIGFVTWVMIKAEAKYLRARLLEAKPEDVLGIVKQMGPYRWWLDPQLKESLAKTTDTAKRNHIRLALLPTDPSQVSELFEQLMQAPPEEFGVIREGLAPYRTNLMPLLDRELDEINPSRQRQFRAACTLADFAPKRCAMGSSRKGCDRIAGIGKRVSHSLLASALHPVADQLFLPLVEMMQRDDLSSDRRQIISAIYQEYARTRPEGLQVVESQFEQQQRRVDGRRDNGAKGRAGIAALLAALGRGDRVWPLLQHSTDPTVRSYLIELLPESGVSFHEIERALELERDVSVRRGLILTLGQFELGRVVPADQSRVTRRLLDWFECDPDSGIHGACDWLLRRWGFQEAIKIIEARLASDEISKDRNWFINKERLTFVIVRSPESLPVAPTPEKTSEPEEPKLAVKYSFAISAKEISVEEFRRHRPDYAKGKSWAPPTPEHPAKRVTWYEAAEYCNSLNADRSQSSYVIDPDDEAKTRVDLDKDWRSKFGYRLPTETEWEMACRAGTATSFSFGEGDSDLAARYAVFSSDARSRSRPTTCAVGDRKPNGWGLFDMHGNVMEWCHEPLKSVEFETSDAKKAKELGRTWPVAGGSFNMGSDATASESRNYVPGSGNAEVGFRIVRRLPDADRKK